MANVLKELKRNIEKASKGTHVATLGDSDIGNHYQNIQTPSYDLNRIISGSLYKGFLDKTFTVIVGAEHTFKSSLIAISFAQAQKKGYIPAIIDTEGGFGTDFAERWGVNADETLYVYEPIIDKIIITLNELLKSGQKLAIGLDSIGNIYRSKILNDADKGDIKADQGALQKEIKSMLKILVDIVKRNNCIAFASGHYYGNPTGYGDADQIGGGKHVRIAPDYIISLKKAKMKDGDAKSSPVIGNEITAVTLKNRFYPPFQEAKIMLDFKKGIDKYAGILGLCQDAGIVERNGAWYSLKETGDRLGQGVQNATDALKQMPDIIDNLDKWLQKTGYSTINRDVETTIKEKEKEEGENK